MAFAPDPLHFFKIIVHDTQDIDMLKIPKKFMNTHGNSLSNTVCLQVPSGGVWKVDVVKIDGGVWLQNGFKEFAEFYSLKYGSLLVFRYDGNSNFWVLIFDTSASEIDYPIRRIPGEEPNLAPDMEEISDQDDLSAQISDEWSPLTLPRKRRGIDLSSETEDDAIRLPSLSDSQYVTTDCKRDILNPEDSRRKSNGSSLDLGENGGVVTRSRELQSEDPAKMKTFDSSGKARAVQRAEAFKPENPFFMIIMQPSHINGSRVTVPIKFAERFLFHENGNIILSASDERTWSVRYVWNVYNHETRATLCCGWKAFVEDQSLKVGDVCVFELIKCRKVSLKVVIFRANSDANCPLPDDDGSIADRVRKRATLQDVEPSEIPVDNLDISSPRLRQEGKGKWSPSSPRVAEALQPVGGSNPSFRVVMLPSYVESKTLNVRSSFVREFTKKSAITVRLQVADNLWPVNIHTYKNHHCSKFCGGFAAFLRENTIKVGDECVFELIDKDGGILNVSILRRGG